MESTVVSENFPLLNAAETETLDWLLSVAIEQDFQPEEKILDDQSWGNAVYFIVSGWVKARRWYNENPTTLSIRGRGDFFGETAILDEPPRATEIITLSETKVISISAQRFIQTLFQDSQLHHKLLQITVRRVRQMDMRLQLRHHPPVVKLASTLINLAENYGKPTEEGMEILLIPETVSVRVIPGSPPRSGIPHFPQVRVGRVGSTGIPLSSLRQSREDERFESSRGPIE